MTPLPSPQQLRYLATLADLRHFGRAARACGVTQSTLSAGILALERQLDIALLDREAGRRVVFTPVGLQIASLAHGALSQLEAVQAAADASRAPMTGPMRLGVIPTVGAFLLPRLLPALKESFPQLQLSLSEDLTERLIEKLASGRLDLLLLAMPCLCDGAETMALARDPFLLALPPGHRLLDRQTISIADLSGEPMLLLEDGHCRRDQMLSACRQEAGWEPPRDRLHSFTATSLHTLVQMVASGLGITLLPRLAVNGGITRNTGVELRPLAGEGAWRTLGLAWRPRTARVADYRTFASLLRFDDESEDATSRPAA
jgi:LysR family hydrogen peroxide-inducible transcriptional activator